MNYLLAAKITTAHGVKGFVKLYVTLEDPTLIERHLLHAKDGRAFKIKLKNRIGKFWVASVEGITDRNAAETLRNTELFIDRAALPAAAEDEYYAADLVGLKAIDLDGREIGTIIAVADFGASPLLEIKPAGKSSFYLPFVADSVPGKPENGMLRIIIPEGLL